MQIKNLKIITLPLAVLIVAVGCLIPVLKVIQEERCQLAFADLTTTDLVVVKSSGQIMAEHPDQLNYLMKHPKMTLKICLDYEAENPDSDQAELLFSVAVKAYSEITGKTVLNDQRTLGDAIQRADPELYGVLTAE